MGLLMATGCDRGSHPGNIDKSAPQFVINDGTRTVDLSKLRGHVVVLNLWATYCAPCIEELPSLLALQRRMPDLAVVAASVIASAFIIYRHSSNIARLRAEAEHPFTFGAGKK